MTEIKPTSSVTIAEVQEREVEGFVRRSGVNRSMSVHKELSFVWSKVLTKDVNGCLAVDGIEKIVSTGDDKVSNRLCLRVTVHLREYFVDRYFES